MTALLDNDPFVVTCVIILCICAAIIAVFIVAGRAMAGVQDSSLDALPTGQSSVDHGRRPVTRRSRRSSTP